MEKYYFFRHGKADSSIEDQQRPLTPDGIKKVKQQALLLSKLSFDLLICSSALRTQQTADLLLETNNPIRIISENLWKPTNPSLRKDIDALVEQVEGDCLADYQAEDKTGLYQKYATLIADEIKKAVENQSAKNILLVGHGIIINAIACILAKEHSSFFKTCKLSTAEGFSFEPGHSAPPQVFRI